MDNLREAVPIPPCQPLGPLRRVIRHPSEYTHENGHRLCPSQYQGPAAALLTLATENVFATPSPQKSFFTRFGQGAGDLVNKLLNNPIQPGVPQDTGAPDPPAEPFSSLLACKARALHEARATAPYRHTGSVPTLCDLLLPAAERPRQFMVGSRKLDTGKVGFERGLDQYQGFVFDTSKPTNSNAGHEYGAAVSHDDRLDSVACWKTL